MATENPIRFGIVGLDHWYAAIPLARQIAARSDTQLIGIADANLEHAREVAEMVGCSRATVNMTELLEDAAVDVIASFISVDRNVNVCTAAARNGKHILSIKPLAGNLADATAIVTAVADAGVLFLPHESCPRAAKVNLLLKKWIDSGRVGSIISASLSLAAGLPKAWPSDDTVGWWCDRSRIPGGGWLSHAIYEVDRLRWLLGREVTKVSGWAGNLKVPDLGIDDYGHAFVHFGDETKASIESTWASPMGGRRTMELVGTKGAVFIDGMTGDLALLEPGSPFDGWMRARIPNDAQTGDAVEAIVAAIRGSRAPIADATDAWENLSVCLAFYEAAAADASVSPEHL